MSRCDNQTILDEIALALSFAPRQSSLRRDRQNGHPDCRCLPIQIVALHRRPNAVDPRRTLVAPHSRQRFLEIVPLDKRFHARSGQGRRAFDRDVRRIGFDPSGTDASGFTRRFHSESQLELDFRPPGQCESPAYLPFQPFGPSVDTLTYFALC